MIVVVDICFSSLDKMFYRFEFYAIHLFDGRHYLICVSNLSSSEAIGGLDWWESVV